MALQDSVRSLMNPSVIYVLPGTPIRVAIDIILSNNYNGIPVTDKGGILVGIVTKYDLITKRELIKDDMTVKDVMNSDPLFLNEDTNIDDAITAFAEHHKVDPIPVVDSEKKVIGVISRYDMVRLFKEEGISSSSSLRISSGSSKNRGTNIFMFTVIIAAVLGGLVYYFFS